MFAIYSEQTHTEPKEQPTLSSLVRALPAATCMQIRQSTYSEEYRLGLNTPAISYYHYISDKTAAMTQMLMHFLMITYD